MRTLIDIPGLLPAHVGAAVYDDLCAIYPEGRRPTAFGLVLPDDDPRTRAVLARLERAGFRPWTERFRKPHADEFTMDLEREYAPADYDAVQYLVPNPVVSFDGYGVDPAGNIRLEVESVVPGEPVAFPTLGMVVVSDAFRRAVESAGLRHATFRPVAPVDADSRDAAWDAAGSRYWQLWSDRVLPPVSCRLLDNNGAVVRGNEGDGCFVDDGLHAYPELHYAAAALAAVPAFDVALTHEWFGIRPTERNRRLVTSQRFRALCAAHGAKMEWIPVRVDP